MRHIVQFIRKVKIPDLRHKSTFLATSVPTSSTMPNALPMTVHHVLGAWSSPPLCVTPPQSQDQCTLHNHCATSQVRDKNMMKRTGRCNQQAGKDEELFVMRDLGRNANLVCCIRKFVHQHGRLDLDFDPSCHPWLPKGLPKTDLVFGKTGKGLRLQIKRYAYHYPNPRCNKNQPPRGGQIDRRTLSMVLRTLPDLGRYAHILGKLFNVPIDPKTRLVDYSIGSKFLTPDNYDPKLLMALLKTMNKNKVRFLELVLLGNDPKMTPNIFCGVRYKDKVADAMHVYLMDDMIAWLSKFKFTIAPDGKGFCLGPALYIRRKGGDRGRPSSNCVQTVMSMPVLEKGPKSFVYKYD